MTEETPKFDVIKPVSTAQDDGLKTESERVEETISEPSEAPKRRGRRPLSDEEKAARKRTRKPRQKKNDVSENNKVIAIMLNSTFFGAVETIGGDGAAPTEGEANELNICLASYLDTKPDLEIPPGAVLALAYTRFLIVKLRQQSVRQRLGEMMLVVRSRFAGSFSRLKSRFTKKRS